jgi:hypothetical protein
VYTIRIVCSRKSSGSSTAISLGTKCALRLRAMRRAGRSSAGLAGRRLRCVRSQKVVHEFVQECPFIQGTTGPPAERVLVQKNHQCRSEQFERSVPCGAQRKIACSLVAFDATLHALQGRLEQLLHVGFPKWLLTDARANANNMHVRKTTARKALANILQRAPQRFAHRAEGPETNSHEARLTNAVIVFKQRLENPVAIAKVVLQGTWLDAGASREFPCTQAQAASLGKNRPQRSQEASTRLFVVGIA